MAMIVEYGVYWGGGVLEYDFEESMLAICTANMVCVLDEVHWPVGCLPGLQIGGHFPQYCKMELVREDKV